MAQRTPILRYHTLPFYPDLALYTWFFQITGPRPALCDSDQVSGPGRVQSIYSVWVSTQAGSQREFSRCGWGKATWELAQLMGGSVLGLCCHNNTESAVGGLRPNRDFQSWGKDPASGKYPWYVNITEKSVNVFFKFQGHGVAGQRMEEGERKKSKALKKLEIVTEKIHQKNSKQTEPKK